MVKQTVAQGYSECTKENSEHLSGKAVEITALDVKGVVHIVDI
jgi:hypothetical protein